MKYYELWTIILNYKTKRFSTFCSRDNEKFTTVKSPLLTSGKCFSFSCLVLFCSVLSTLLHLPSVRLHFFSLPHISFFCEKIYHRRRTQEGRKQEEEGKVVHVHIQSWPGRWIIKASSQDNVIPRQCVYITLHLTEERVWSKTKDIIAFVWKLVSHKRYQPLMDLGHIF